MADHLAGELDRWSKRTQYRGDTDLVFAHPQTGSPLDRSKVSKRFKAACRAAGVRGSPCARSRSSSGTPTARPRRSTRTTRHPSTRSKWSTTPSLPKLGSNLGSKVRPTPLHSAPLRPTNPGLDRWVPPGPSGCGPGGRGFESPRSPLRNACKWATFLDFKRVIEGSLGNNWGTSFFWRRVWACRVRQPALQPPPARARRPDEQKRSVTDR